MFLASIINTDNLMVGLKVFLVGFVCVVLGMALLAAALQLSLWLCKRLPNLGAKPAPASTTPSATPGPQPASPNTPPRTKE